MNVVCVCGAHNSVFTPLCWVCGAPVEEGLADRAMGALRGGAVPLFAPGATIGDYTLERFIASGSLGRVFLARSKDGTRVALKMLHPHLLQDEESRARFLLEAGAVSKLRHPSVGVIHAAFEVGRTPILVLEYYEGETLRALVDGTREFDLASIRPLLVALVEALGALHDGGWVHRDLKPENVMVLDAGARAPKDIRLLDFALAKSIVPSVAGGTAAGAFVGSFHYAAPEQLLGEPVGPGVDWWALGVVAYELLMGERPFKGPSRSELTRAVLRSEPPLRGLDRAMVPWISTLLSVEPAARPATWRDALRLLPEVRDNVA